MYKLVALLLVIALINADVAPNLGVARQYQEWKAEHGISYDDDEDRYRLYLFAQKQAEIEQHNSDPSQTWKKGHNQFSCMTAEEFEMTVFGLKVPNNVRDDADSGDSDNSGDTPIVSEEDNDDDHPIVRQLPASKDWSSHTPPIRNQRSCGSCWAFSATAVIETQYILKKGQNRLTFDLSEQQSVDCAKNAYNGCNGGWMAWTYDLAVLKGIVSEASYPYTATWSRSCKTPAATAYKIARYATSTSGTTVAQRVNNMLVMIAASGPVSVALCATNTWSSYRSGVLASSACSSTCSVNHAVVAYGYTALKDWLIRNSWGTSWGASGNMVMKAGNTCRIADNRGQMVYF